MRPFRSSRDDRAFEQFVRGHRGRLVTTARLLTAGDGHAAEDLVQTTLVKVLLSWPKVRGDRMAYARRTLLNAFLDQQRKPVRRREILTDDLPDRPAHPDRSGQPALVDEDLDPELVAALAELPPRMRAAVVLRHVHDLSVATVADLLGCDPGTVKSQSARGLAKLRTHLSIPTPETGARP